MLSSNALGLAIMPNLTNNKLIGQLYTLFVRREKRKEKITQTIDHRRQSNYYLLTRITPCGRGHDCTFNETTDDQIWPLESVICTFFMARAPPIRYGRKRKQKKHLTKR